jgi:hypothetical protein
MKLQILKYAMLTVVWLYVLVYGPAPWLDQNAAGLSASAVMNSK